MRRREFVRGLGVLAGGVSIGGAVSTVGAQSGVPVQQVVEEGVPQPRSELTVAVAERVDGVDADRVHVWTYVVDPLSGGTEARLLDVVDATVTTNGVRLVVDGPLSQGAVVSFAESSVVLDGTPQAAFTYTPTGRLLEPERATQWFKAYEPTDPSYFDPVVYPTSRYREGEWSHRRGRVGEDGTTDANDTKDPDDTRDDTDPGRVRARLASHLDRFVARDRLTVAERDRTMARFDDDAVRARFLDGDGRFDPEALAGVLANAGTVAGGVDTVLVDGDNRFGRPYTVRRQPTVSGGCMEVLVDRGRPTVLVDPSLDAEPFVVLAPLFAHEGLHQDLSVGLDEEVVATYLETLVWAEHVLAAPEVARLGTPKARQLNTMLLLALNSGGRSFPDVGLTAAPHRQQTTNATPDAAVAARDFASVVESKYARTRRGPSPGSPYARQVLERVTDEPLPGVAFDPETRTLLDERTRLFSAADVGRLLAALELRLAPSTTTGTLAVPDPVAAADAGARDERHDTRDDAWDDARQSDLGAGHPRVGACGTCLRGGVRG